MRHFGGAMSPGRPAPGTGAGRKGLKSDALGMFSSVAMGLASTGPAYSLAATLGVIVAGVGLQAPIVTMLAFIPMLLVAYAFRELNASNADCGTTFTWSTRAFGPRTGWMGGWGIIVADIIVMVSLAEIAAAYGFRLVGLDALAENRLWTTVAGIAWIAVLTAVCYVGIEFSAAVQRWLLCLEVVMLILFAVTALVRVYADPPATAIHVSASWFNPFEVPSAAALTSGILAGVFIYWGWDTAFSVNEETVDSACVPGRAAVLSTVLLLVMYGLVSTSAQAFAGVGTSGVGLGNANNSDDVFSGLGEAVFGSHDTGMLLSRLLILMVLTSSLASAQTTILPLARTVFSMAVHKAVPARFALIHRRFLTPIWGTVGMGAVSIAVLVLLTSFSRNILADSIDSVGLAIAFQYGLTGFACVWYHRKVLTRSVKDLVFKGVLPGLGGLMMALLFLYAAFVVYSDPRYGTTSVDLPLIGRTGGVTVLGLGALLIGFLLMPLVTRGHTVALKLQRGLLPHRLPRHAAVDAASRYLPADSGSGVGGDWYDVIPLSGTRVGLVVGDVLGHGMRAAATMGRLSTGVRVLARLDLSPDELLSRLDDLVEQAAHEGGTGRGPRRLRSRADAGLGVTCLYAVYDPVSGKCSLARAGEPVLAVVEPRTGVVGYPDLPTGPPLGIGGPPYQSAELDFEPGSLVALFTGGLLQAADDRDAGLERLAEVLAGDRGSLEKLCDRAVAKLLPGPVDVDATLLVVRTRLLDRSRFAEWALLPDPAGVATIRTAVSKQLRDWGLDDLSFTSELIVSELVTNAIRYVGGSIQVRLIRDRTLICEVSDTGHTTPNLRHAASDDEGGRGLFIIAQMTHHWGTRYTSTGKTIWTEQDLPPVDGQ
ncbi:amino acid transporter/anti-sigma regulatory factor (Ser/Thr protein kinase) [Streptomyces griseochromogenes]|uniref:Amino acid transporter/anti-sigma regulatory factor (Ser/Thr protein kinase) n=1 Tax=Streptomyces griseochromogenes TaxID=68214 RepID=A0ABS4LT53_9ACTN|nr:amino acid permease [Streptomyces griseochromogenes]MBP2050589.1 amino acid transporter/anti-sigma regulatory factor (Ser/Thr protein kinase) [Streptomyces griseochromogenes]